MVRFFCVVAGMVLASIAAAGAQPVTPAAAVAPVPVISGNAAIDGSTFTLRPASGGLVRQIVSSGGTVHQSLFTPLNDRLGTVSEDGRVVGLFARDGAAFATEYADGRSEILVVDPGHVSMTLKDGSGHLTCSSWYPAGHHFSIAERKAALAQYAQRLGVEDERYGMPAQSKNGGCAAVSKDMPAAEPSAGGPALKSSAAGHSDTLKMIMGQVLALYRQPFVQSGADRFADQAAWDGFEKFYSSFLAAHEGGYTDNDGNGSPANFGINQGANPDVDVASLTQDQAKQILYERYWLASGADRLPFPLAFVHGDTAVNFGVRAANDLLAQSGGDPNTYLALRDARYLAIAAPNPDKARYLPIWQARNEDLRSLIGKGENEDQTSEDERQIPPFATPDY